MSDWESDRDKSRRGFLEFISPYVEDWTGGEFVNIEDTTEDSVAEKLDQIAGVDAWDIKVDDGIRPIGSRVQWNRKEYSFPFVWPFDTFTVRKSRDTGVETEFEKRKHQINNDLLYPYWTVQGYLDRRRTALFSVALTITKPLIKHIENGSEGSAESWKSARRTRRRNLILEGERRVDGYGDGDYWVMGVEDDDGSKQEMYCVDWYYLRDEALVPVKFKRPYLNKNETKASFSQGMLKDFA